MKITSIHLKNFLVFKGELDAEFCEGINVIVGGNATGKTTILKCIYAACEFSNDNAHPNITKKFQHFFTPSSDINRDVNRKAKDHGFINIFCDKFDFHFRLWDKFFIDKWLKLGIKSIFIPSTEMLSHSKGLLAMAQKYGVPFDGTQIDILVNAQLWETKEINDRNQKILNMLGKAIDGEVVYENDMFYIIKNNGSKIEYPLEAEGLKRIGLLWKLIRNGLLESGSILLWDEPESSIHPEHFSLISDVLYILANDGVQIFVSTHDYNFAKYIEIKKEPDVSLKFHSLSKSTEAISVESGNSFGNLQNNDIVTSLDKLMDEAITGNP